MEFSYRMKAKIKHLIICLVACLTQAGVGAPAGEVSPAVAVVLGSDAAAQTFAERSRALAGLGKDLDAVDVGALLDYLGAGDDSLHVGRVAALKNDIMNALRLQREFPQEFVPRVAAIFNARVVDETSLDYCIQHLGASQSQTTNVAHQVMIRDTIRRASLEPAKSWSGTALIAMNGSRNSSDSDEAFSKERALKIAADPKAHEAARISAFQLCGENGFAEALPLLRDALASNAASISLKTVAIGALGLIGDESDAAMLKAMLESNPPPRLVPALKGAVEKMGDVSF